jgi:large subunit ribosomal protein L29
LTEQVKGVARGLFQNRMKNFTNQLDNTAGLKAARREIARVRTVLRERAIAALKGEAK